jgi:HEAT repeat protein
MEPNAVPYLTQQLHYDRSGVRQKLLAYLRRHAVTSRFTANLIWPPERRSYAAVALRQMGPKAEAAIPALLETWAHDTSDVKLSAVSALESILRGRYADSASQAEWRRLESDVITEAARRYPRVAEELGIGPNRVR